MPIGPELEGGLCDEAPAEPELDVILREEVPTMPDRDVISKDEAEARVELAPVAFDKALLEPSLPCSSEPDLIALSSSDTTTTSR